MIGVYNDTDIDDLIIEKLAHFAAAHVKIDPAVLYVCQSKSDFHGLSTLYFQRLQDRKGTSGLYFKSHMKAYMWIPPNLHGKGLRGQPVYNYYEHLSAANYYALQIYGLMVHEFLHNSEPIHLRSYTPICPPGKYDYYSGGKYRRGRWEGRPQEVRAIAAQNAAIEIAKTDPEISFWISMLAVELRKCKIV